jgi:2-polyprenyl-3-methyl-5-hydroxy-6-metoxy-1,4-benzoquinol methylase
MKALDRFIQRWRIRKVRRFVRAGARVLDVGCADGALFRLIPHIEDGIGIDPFIDGGSNHGRYVLIKGWFPDDLPDERPFDAIAMLAVLEHVPADRQEPLARACERFLKPGGQLLITVPSPTVDRILAVLKALRLIDGMSLEQHYGYDNTKTADLFTATGLRLAVHRRFQLGLNNLFVFEKPSAG